MHRLIKKIDGLIITGGNIKVDFALKLYKKADQIENIEIIAVDKGTEFFIKNNLKYDIAIGDFDSIDSEVLKSVEEKKKINLKKEKDDTDTKVAVDYLISKGKKNIVILGGTGSRVDHVLANLGLVIYAKNKNVNLYIIDEGNFISYCNKKTTLEYEKYKNYNISFFAFNTVSSLSLKGFKYPLHNYELFSWNSCLTVSNYLISTGEVSYAEGEMLILVTKDL